MARPELVAVTVPDPIFCSKRTDVAVTVRVNEKDTNLTICFEFRESDSCRFVSMSDDSKRMLGTCRRRLKLAADTHDIDLRVKIWCPEGDVYGEHVKITVENDKNEKDSMWMIWTIDCE